MDQPKTYKRLNIFVHKSLQIKFTLFVLILFMMSGFAVWWEAYHSMGNFVALGFGDDQVRAIINQFNKILLVKMAIEILLIVFISLVFSHYIAGPIYRLQEAMKAVRDGDSAVRLRFRRLDEFKNIAELFNQMMEALQQRKRS